MSRFQDRALSQSPWQAVAAAQAKDCESAHAAVPDTGSQWQTADLALGLKDRAAGDPLRRRP